MSQALMQAVEIAGHGGPEVLRLCERPVPQAAAGEVLIKVAAAGVNRPDVIQRQGNYPPPAGASDLPGLEIAGTVAALGSGTSRFKVGDSVMALVAGGGYAAYCTAPEPQCLPVPPGLSMAEAAAVPETYFTVWHNLFERGRLAAGEAALVHGGTSGIGTTALQLARAFGAKPIFATAGSAEKCRACEALGATRAINYKAEDFVAVIKDAAPRGVDVVLDMIGGQYIQRNFSVLAADGRLVFIAFLDGAAANVNFMPVLLKRLTVTGSTLRARTVAVKGAIAAALEREVWPLLATGTVKPLIDRIFPLAAAADAHRLMEGSSHIGKLVLTI